MTIVGPHVGDSLVLPSLFGRVRRPSTERLQMKSAFGSLCLFLGRIIPSCAGVENGIQIPATDVSILLFRVREGRIRRFYFFGVNVATSGVLLVFTKSPETLGSSETVEAIGCLGALSRR